LADKALPEESTGVISKKIGESALILLRLS